MQAVPIQADTVLATGPTCQGRIATHPGPDEEGYILLVRRPTIGHFHALRRCKAVLCEEGGATSHPAVLCRIWGKPLLSVAGATARFQDGEVVTLAPSRGEVHHGVVPVDDREADEGRSLANFIRAQELQFQVSVVDASDIARTNDAHEAANRVRQFFVREELLWVKADREPFTYLRERGADAVVTFLAGQLEECVRELQPGQVLNFRSLDMRSDETPVPGSLGVEANPQLGNHGIRRTLREGGPFLALELRALTLLSPAERQRVIFSLPFVTEEEEVRAAEQLARRFCPALPRLGVFIETAAAVSELGAILAGGDVRHVSVGTKDLTQTILACDRGNASVRHLYSPRKRSVMAAIQSVLVECRAHRTPVVLFASSDELRFFTERLPEVETFSMCCGEFLQLFHPQAGAVEAQEAFWFALRAEDPHRSKAYN